MSEVIEKESTVSALVSSIGAWFALGSGLAILLGLYFAVISTSFAQNPNRLPSAQIQQVLSRDLSTADPASISVAHGGRTLLMIGRRGDEGAKLSISYSTNNDQRILYRETSAKEKAEFGVCNDLRFALEPGSLRLDWSQGRLDERQRWALKRGGR